MNICRAFMWNFSTAWLPGYRTQTENCWHWFPLMLRRRELSYKVSVSFLKVLFPLTLFNHKLAMSHAWVDFSPSSLPALVYPLTCAPQLFGEGLENLSRYSASLKKFELPTTLQKTLPVDSLQYERLVWLWLLGSRYTSHSLLNYKAKNIARLGKHTLSHSINL